MSNNESALVLFDECTPLFNALGDKERQKIVLLLARNERMSASEIQNSFHLSSSTISHHLKILRELDLVDFEKVGTQRIYYLTINESMRKLKALAEEVLLICDL
ncbi:ArsR/SmtB family transcription factor [Bacillus sp. CHD6a]|uniref:ArsR/SmtB family transcription factor n=1 Tax=Bacillus sp. CHD6a TaxID=1643452 RepID=UPI0006CCD939|nr:metalloregulator ArsR/SmtB family transcription factor [Bacillus sp. CHD6a]KPB03408.1 hypothetical protein AAV98_17530 [Bacillus sp. CHD6a]